MSALAEEAAGKEIGGCFQLWLIWWFHGVAVIDVMMMKKNSYFISLYSTLLSHNFVHLYFLIVSYMERLLEDNLLYTPKE